MLKLLSLFRKLSITDNVPPEAIAPLFSSPQTQTYWARLRRPRLEHEEVLSGWTRSWLEALPEHLRPTHLGSCHPHIANRLALSWRDLALTEHVFDDLLIDRRAGRKGFSPAVLTELLRLREFHGNGRAVQIAQATSESPPLSDQLPASAQTKQRVDANQ